MLTLLYLFQFCLRHCLTFHPCLAWNYLTQAGLQFVANLLPQLPRCWDYGHGPPHPAWCLLINLLPQMPTPKLILVFSLKTKLPKQFCTSTHTNRLSANGHYFLWALAAMGHSPANTHLLEPTSRSSPWTPHPVGHKRHATRCTQQ